MRPPSPCSVPGCPQRKPCPVHGKRHQAPRQAPRPSAAAQGYGSEWRKRRAAYLKMYPQCNAPGCFAPATEVDHIIPKSRGGSDSESNWQSLCKSHHSQKTARENHFGGRRD